MIIKDRKQIANCTIAEFLQYPNATFRKLQNYMENFGSNRSEKGKMGGVWNMSHNETLEYYNANAKSFTLGTIDVNFEETQEKFLNYISPQGRILDFGCGSGRDAKYFHIKGFEVDAVDGSVELCKLAAQYTGINVKQMLFSDLDAVEQYDGIWACASILHLSSSELRDVLLKMIKALKNNGIMYISFKYGDYEGMRNGRYFTDFTETSFEKYIADIGNVEIKELWVTGDIRPGRGDEKWLNLILQKLDTH